MGFKFDSTISLKEMIDRAEHEQATEIKRVLPAQRNLTDVELGFRRNKECRELLKKN